MEHERGQGGELARKWLRNAESDLIAAKALKSIAGVTPNLPAFHFQQAAEKAMKGLLLLAGADFPFTHNLKRLAVLVDAACTGGPFDWPAELARLSAYAVVTRYDDDPASKIGTTDLEAADDAATAVVAMAAARIEAWE